MVVVMVFAHILLDRGQVAPVGWHPSIQWELFSVTYHSELLEQPELTGTRAAMLT